MNWIMRMLKQPSTYRGLSLILGAVGVAISPELVDKIGLAVIAILGLIEAIRDEKKPITTPQVQEIVDERQPIEEPQRITTPELSDEQKQDLNSN